MNLRLLVLALAAAASGCSADYVARTRGVRAAYEAYDTPRAVKLIDQELKADGEQVKDKLLLLLDKGMVLHAGGQYEESIRVLAQADRLSQELDAVSVSEEAKTLVTNERERAYRGEDFEKLMISVLQALNYAQLGRDDDALVEVRRVNERIRKMVAEEKKPYEQLAIARYLGGVLYEDQGEQDSAIIDYLDAYRLQPNLGALAEPLLRLAKQTGRDDVYEKLKEKYPDLSHEPLGPQEGQVVVVVEAGKAPQKIGTQTAYPGSIQLVDVPRFISRGAPRKAEVSVGDSAATAVTVTSLSDVAQVHLQDRIGRMLAKSVATTAVKAGLAAGVGALTQSRQLGALAFLLLAANNQVDLRSWLSLPAEFQVARLRLPAGEHTVSVQSGGRISTHPVVVKPRRIQVLVLRRY